MDATTSTPAETAFAAAEPGKRFLDPFAEWRDCANQWDVSEVWRTPQDSAKSGPEGGQGGRIEGYEPATQ